MSEVESRIIMKTIATALLVSAISTICHASPWTIQRETDSMTDEVYFLVGTHSTAAIEIMPYITYRPAIVLQIHPKGFNKSGGLLYTSESTLTIEHDGFIRSGNDITIRFDKEPSTTENWNSSTDRRAAFHPHSQDFISKLFTHTNLTVRYQTSLGSIRTAMFDIRDLKKMFNRIKSECLKTYGKPIAQLAREAASTPSAEKPTDDTPPPSSKPASAVQPSPKPVRPITPTETTCSACSGRGKVPARFPCDKCSGAGRIYQSGKWQKCPKTVTRGTKPCPTCNGTGKTSSL